MHGSMNVKMFITTMDTNAILINMVTLVTTGYL